MPTRRRYGAQHAHGTAPPRAVSFRLARALACYRGEPTAHPRALLSLLRTSCAPSFLLCRFFRRQSTHDGRSFPLNKPAVSEGARRCADRALNELRPDEFVLRAYGLAPCADKGASRHYATHYISPYTFFLPDAELTERVSDVAYAGMKDFIVDTSIALSESFESLGVRTHWRVVGCGHVPFLGRLTGARSAVPR